MEENDTLKDERVMKIENIKTRTHKPYALKGCLIELISV